MYFGELDGWMWNMMEKVDEMLIWDFNLKSMILLWKNIYIHMFGIEKFMIIWYCKI